MNTYKITFTRENGTTGSDNFTAADEKQARRDFKEVYRHGNGTITDVELVREDVPATKQQERNALSKIRAIVETLGPYSYIATSFAGCFEDAEENIENDFDLSMKDRYESAKREADELREKLSESEKDYEAAHAAAHEVADRKDTEIAALKEELKNRREIATHNAKQADEARNDLGDAQRRAEEAEAEVIRLKAKLYDYITAGA